MASRGVKWKNIFPFFPLADGAEGGSSSFLHLLCALHSMPRGGRQLARTYVYFMHSNADAAASGEEEACAIGGRARGGSAGGGVAVGCRIVDCRRGRVATGRGGCSWSYQEATYKIIRHVGHAHHPAASPIAGDCI